MSIIRGARPESGWYALDRRISEDERLGWAARGLLVFLLGKPDNWRVSVEHLRAQTKGARIRTGRDGIYALLSELEQAGYITTRQGRRDDGTMGQVDYIVHEIPVSEGVRPPLPAQPEPAKPDTAQPDTAQPLPAQPTLDKTETADKTDSRKGRCALSLPEWLPADAWQDWHDYRNSRKGWTKKAKELSLRTLTELWSSGHDPRQVIEQSIERGWTGLFPVRSDHARAGPAAPAKPGKQMQGLMALEGLKRGSRLDSGRNRDGAAEALPALAGPHAGR